MPSQERRYGPAIEAHFQFLMWLIPAVEKFPRTQKFLLGDRIQTTALDVMPFAFGFARVAETTISESARTSVQGRS